MKKYKKIIKNNKSVPTWKNNFLYLVLWGQRTRYKRYYHPTVEIKNYNVLIDGQNFFDKPGCNDLITFERLRKIASGQEDDYTSACLLDYNYFKKY